MPTPARADKDPAVATRLRSGEAPGRASPRPPLRMVPDTSVIVDGRFTRRVADGEYAGAEILVPEAVVAELENQANQGMDAGFNGLEELIELQAMAARGVVTLRFVGRRPDIDEIKQARFGGVDALVRDSARDENAELVTGDKVQAQVCSALGIPCRYLRVADEEVDVDRLGVTRYFGPGVMSVHLKQDVVPFIKRGTPGKREYVPAGTERLTKRDLATMAREIVEAARRDDRSFVEIEREGATVVQLRNMRIAIARPPFSDALEITAVRPVIHLELADYKLPDPVRARLTDKSRGIFVSGPPGSGKSTFAQAVAEYLDAKGTVVKTMESPRDLDLPDAITQYAPLERDIELTGDFLLLVRPDFVVYDEVRKTRDFEVFADMRLAGVGLIGVTHANRAIDAVQRLIGRVELGMIPQVVDTVVHIEGGVIQQILEMDFTVRVPSGMTEADLARPVIRVRDFQTKKELFEIYTYGEQVVVMPIQGQGGPGGGSGASRLAERSLSEMLSHQINGPFEVEMTGPESATLYVADWEIAGVIGRGGTNVQQLERRTGVKLDVKTLEDLRARGFRGGQRRRKRDDEGEEDDDGETEFEGDGSRGAGKIRPKVRMLKKQVVVFAGAEFAGVEVEVHVDGRAVASGRMNGKGEMRLHRGSAEAKRLFAADKAGADVELVML